MKLQTGDGIDISCTWREGSDVCVNILRNPEKLKNWPKGFFPIDLTGNEAIQIGRELIRCGERAQRLDNIVVEHEEGEKK